jgi:hypothetical protein
MARLIIAVVILTTFSCSTRKGINSDQTEKQSESPKAASPAADNIRPNGPSRSEENNDSARTTVIDERNPSDVSKLADIQEETKPPKLSSTEGQDNIPSSIIEQDKEKEVPFEEADEVVKYKRAMANGTLDIEPPLMKIGDFGHYRAALLATSPKFSPKSTIIQVFADKILVHYDWSSVPTWKRKAAQAGFSLSGIFCVEGIDTTGLVSNANWSPASNDVFDVTKTTTYTSVDGGTSTVFVLTKVRPDRIKAYLAIRSQKMAEEEKERQQKAKEFREKKATEDARIAREKEEENERVENAKYREWNNINEESFEAKISGSVGDKVILKKRDGKSVIVPIENLSAQEQEFVNKWKKEREKYNRHTVKPNDSR